VDRGCRPEAEVPGRSARGVDLRMSWSSITRPPGCSASFVLDKLIVAAD